MGQRWSRPALSVADTTNSQQERALRSFAAAKLSREDAASPIVRHAHTLVAQTDITLRQLDAYFALVECAVRKRELSVTEEAHVAWVAAHAAADPGSRTARQ